MATDNCKIFQDSKKKSAKQNLKENTKENTIKNLKQKKNELIFIDSPKKISENLKGDNKDNVTNENDRNYSLESDLPFEKTNENQSNYYNENQINEQYKNYDLQDHFYVNCNCIEEQLNTEELKVIDILSRHVQLDLKRKNIENYNCREFNDNSLLIRCRKCESPRDYSKMTSLINCIKKDEEKNQKKNKNQDDNKQKKDQDKKKQKKTKEKNEKEIIVLEDENISEKETESIVNDSQSIVNDNQTPLKDDDSEETTQSETQLKKKYVINKPKRKYFCEKCGSKFTSSYGMKYHNDKVHTTEKDLVIKPFPCPIDNCLKRYKNNNGLKYHLNNQHSTS